MLQLFASINILLSAPIKPDTSDPITTVDYSDRSHLSHLVSLLGGSLVNLGFDQAHHLFDEMLSSLFAFPLFPFLLLPLATCDHHQAPVAASPSSSSNSSTVYDILSQYGLPPGLLPDTVTAFTFSKDTGEFVVNLSGPCYVEFEYLVYYEPTVTGVVRYGVVSQLKGIQVQRFFLWLNVDAIKVDLPYSNYIYFDVGWVTKKLSADQFKTVHSCRSDGLIDIVTNATASWFSV